MVIFRTSPDTIQKVVHFSKHALESQPRLMAVGEIILISQTVAGTRDGKPRIRYMMKFVRIYPDTQGESLQIWGRQWRYIVEGQSCRSLRRPFNIQQFQVSGTDYSRGGPIVYVAPEDERIILERGLLETL